MRNLPVHWYEGLFLRPHHFQAADRHLAELMQTSLEFDHPYAYGVRAIEFDKDALAINQFELRSLRARMRDGTIVVLDAGQPLVRLDLKPAFKAQAVVRIVLAVPKAQLGQANVATAAQESAGSLARHREQVQQHMQDETRGGNDKEVKLKALNVRLMVAGAELAGYEVLPLAQVERAGEQGAVPRLDLSYIPPVLAIDAWPELGRDIVRAIGDLLRKKFEVLGQQVATRGITFDSREPGDLERLLLLSQLYGAATALSVLASARGVHPFVAYCELARIVGLLAIFGKDRTLPAIPDYDHDDLARIFRALMMWLLDALINAVRDFEFEQRYFLGAGLGMQVTLEARWFHSDWQWFVGVHKEEITEQECLELLSAGRLDWKLGSSRQVEFLFTRGGEGLKLIPAKRHPRALPESRDWLYFEVSRANDAWKDVQATQTLALRLREAMILNLDRLQGERTLIVAADDRQVALQFALFAVPNRA